MVVPVSLDPGRNDPRSPYFEGCHSCGTPGVSSPCRDCQALQAEQEAEAAYWESQMEERMEQRKEPYPIEEEAEAVAGDEDG